MKRIVYFLTTSVLGIVLALAAISTASAALNAPSGGSNVSLKSLLLTGNCTFENFSLACFNDGLKHLTQWGVDFAATVAFIFVLIGGLQYLTSAGDPGKAESGRKTLTWAIVGLLVVLAAYAIVTYFVDNVVKTSTTADSSSQTAISDNQVSPTAPAQTVADTSTSCPISMAPLSGSYANAALSQYAISSAYYVSTKLADVSGSAGAAVGSFGSGGGGFGGSIGNPSVVTRAKALIGHDSLIPDKNNGCAAFTAAALGPLTTSEFGNKDFAPSHWESTAGTKFFNKAALSPGDEVYYTNDEVGKGVAASNGDPLPSYKKGDHVPMHVGIYIGSYSGPDGRGGTVNLSDAVVNNSGASGPNGKIIVQSLAQVGQTRVNSDGYTDYFMGGKHYTTR